MSDRASEGAPPATALRLIWLSEMSLKGARRGAGHVSA